MNLVGVFMRLFFFNKSIDQRDQVRKEKRDTGGGEEKVGRGAMEDEKKGEESRKTERERRGGGKEGVEERGGERWEAGG